MGRLAGSPTSLQPGAIPDNNNCDPLCQGRVENGAPARLAANASAIHCCPAPRPLRTRSRTFGEGRMWQQVYDPFGNSVLSTIAAAIPVVTCSS